MWYDPDDISKDSQGVRIYCDDNPNKVDTKQRTSSFWSYTSGCHSFSNSSQPQCGFTADECQP